MNARLRGQGGFTLIELMITVAILGLLAAVAITAYTKNIKRARKTEVVGDLSKLSVLQEAAFRVRGHYISTGNTGINSFDSFYPLPSSFAGGTDGRNANIIWRTSDAGYHMTTLADGPGTRGGGLEHVFDALGFMPEGNRTVCSYATRSGAGTFVNPSTGGLVTDAPHSTMLGVVFNNDPRFTTRPWFVNMAACDLDSDGVFWFFYNNSYESQVFDGLELTAAGAARNAY